MKRFNWKLLLAVPRDCWTFARTFVLVMPSRHSAADFAIDILITLIAIPCLLLIFISGIAIAIFLNLIGRADLMGDF